MFYLFETLFLICRGYWLWVSLLILMMQVGVAWAGADTLESWRNQITLTRQLAERDAPAALQDAQRLQAQLPTDALPTDRVRVLNLMSHIEAYLIRIEDAVAHAKQAQDLAAQYKDKVGLAEVDLSLALAAVSQGQLEQLDTLIPHCMEMLEGSNRPDLLSEAMGLAAMTYQRKGLLDDAVAVSMRSLELARQSRDPMALAYAYWSEDRLFLLSDRPLEAREHIRHMLDQARIAGSLRLQSAALVDWARWLNNQGDFSGAEQQIRTSVDYARRTGIPTALTVSLYALAENLHMQGKTAAAIEVLDEVVAIYEKHPHKTGLWWALYARSEYAQSLGRRSDVDAERAWNLAQEIGVPLYLVKSSQRLAAIAASRNDWKHAYEYTAKVSKMLESLAKDGSGARMAVLAQRFEEDSERRRIEALTRENERQQAQHRWMLMLLGSVGVVMVGVLLFLAQQRRSNLRLVEVNRQLQAEEHRFRTLVENLPDAVVRYDRNCRRILANSAYYEVTGFKEEDVIGKTPMEVHVNGNVGPNAFQAHMRSVMTSGQTANLLSRFTGKDGRLVYLDYRLTPEYGPDGTLLGLLGIGHDVSELKHAQALLQEREAEFRTLVELSPDVIIRYDENLRRTYVNPTYIRLNGTMGDSVLGKTVSEAYFYDEQKAAYQTELHLVMEYGQSRDFHLKWPAIEGGLLHMHVRAVPELDDAGKIRSVLVVGRDMTGQKELELQLQESQTMLRALAERNESIREAERRHLAREVHDELGQMLNAVRLNLIVLHRRFGGNNTEMKGVMETMLEHLGNTIAIARNIVLALHPTVLDAGIATALDWLVREFRKSSRIDCRLTVDEGVVLDQTQSMVIFRVVQESLTNVAKHAAASAVEISLSRHDGLYRLEISDNGHGFDVDEPRARRSLGLVGMRERVFMLGGTLDLTSAPGAGTIVHIKFPMMQAEKEETV